MFWNNNENSLKFDELTNVLGHFYIFTVDDDPFVANNISGRDERTRYLNIGK